MDVLKERGAIAAGMREGELVVASLLNAHSRGVSCRNCKLAHLLGAVDEPAADGGLAKHYGALDGDALNWDRCRRRGQPVM